MTRDECSVFRRCGACFHGIAPNPAHNDALTVTLCAVEGCRNDVAGPRDRNGFCATCADAIEEQDREHDMEDCQ